MELLNPALPRGRCAVAMIDFDGTLSLLREGWDQVMIPMMVDVLLPWSDDNRTKLTSEVTDWVLKLNGQPTLEQMAALAREVTRRGGRPAEPGDYKREYLSRLMQEVHQRRAKIALGQDPSVWVVPGAYTLLEGLRRRNIPMLLASGTDLQPLRDEATLLRLDHYFTDGIHGPESDASTFTKAAAVDAVLHRRGLNGCQLLNVGDGYVETKLTKDRGGLAIGVAYDPERPGQFHRWRYDQLREAGADVIVPDLLQSEELLKWLLDSRG